MYRSFFVASACYLLYYINVSVCILIISGGGFRIAILIVHFCKKTGHLKNHLRNGKQSPWNLKPMSLERKETHNVIIFSQMILRRVEAMKAFDLRTKTFSRMSSRGSRLGMRSMLSSLADAGFSPGLDSHDPMQMIFQAFKKMVFLFPFSIYVFYS